MKANEFRIGNWVFDRNDSPGQINELKRHPSCDNDFGYIITFKELGRFGKYVKDVQPIPLTPEILERCGFAKHDVDEYVYYSIDDIMILTDHPEYYLCYISDVRMGGLSTIGNSFAHLHDLQNLYFALTGEELIFINL